MADRDRLTRENAALRERLDRLIDASLRINASLDLHTVLSEVLEAARALTDARCGVIATIDAAGGVEEFVSSGLTDEELQRMNAWPHGEELWAHLRDLPGPVRQDDMSAYVVGLGFAAHWAPGTTFQGTPMHHRGAHVGSFFVAGKAHGESFTEADEEMLLLFAGQAAAAVANARTYRKERRARADLEALVETSPVGVVVFDAATGSPVSYNREAVRIVEPLRTPGQPAEQLLDQIVSRRGDGREISLRGYPIARQLNDNPPAVRAEEIVLAVPDGRSIATLVNATPIHNEAGDVVSMVVTLQDLGPLQELERMRSEFIGLVSHELRAPLTSIQGSAGALLRSASVLDPAEMQEYFRIIDEQAEHMRGLIGDLLDAGRIEAGTLSVSLEPAEVAGLVDRARTTFLSGGSPHTVLIDLPDELPRVMAEPRRIVQVLGNLLSNAARHSPGATPIRIAAERDGTHVAVSVADEGRGMTQERLTQLFRKHTRPEDGEVGLGGGLGLSICRGLVEAHGGRIWAESPGPGQGATFTFTVAVAADAVAGQTGSSRTAPSAQAADAPAVLVLDDDPRALRYVRDALTESGYRAIVTGEHRELGQIIRAERPRLVLLDLVLPGTDGIELMRSVPELSDLPVIFISGYGRDETIARALESGAADYLVKPFSPTELTTRIRAALRRAERPEPFALGALAIDFDRRRVHLEGRELELTATEYEVLCALALNAGRATTYEALLHSVWKDHEHANVKLVRAYVKRLRCKLGDDAKNPAYIVTVRGVGYRMKRTVGR